MKFVADNLATALAIAGAAVARKSTIPILDCVLIKAMNDGITIIGSDLETEIVTSIPADIEEPGAICVNASKLIQIIRSAPPGAIEMKAKDGKLAIKTAKSRHRLNTLPSNEYPMTDPSENGATINLPAADFATHIGNIEQCAATDDVRTFLNGINIQCTVDTIVFNASDGHRLGCSILNLPADQNNEEISTILPKKAAQTITKIFKTGQIDLTIDADSARVSDGQTTITCRCVVGKYPNLKEMLADRSEICAQIDAENLAAAIARIESTTGELFGIKLNIEPEKLILTSVDPNGQESESITEIEYDGQPMELAYNCKYLIDAAKHIQGPAILHLPELEKQTNRGAIFLRPESDIYQYCIMPIHL